MARSATKLHSCRWLLCNLLTSIARRGPGWIAKENRPLDVPTASDCRGGFRFHHIGWILGVTFDSIRFWQLHQSLALTSVFHVWQIAQRRADSIRVGLCLWHQLAVPPVQSCSTSSGAWRSLGICENIRNQNQSCSVRERA